MRKQSFQTEENQVVKNISFDTAKLYPQLTPKEQQEAAYFLERYLDVICRIYERTSRLTKNE